MTIENTKDTLKDLQQLESLASALHSMSIGYEMPESFRQLTEDLFDKIESMKYKNTAIKPAA
jgi:hypothetical protein